MKKNNDTPDTQPAAAANDCEPVLLTAFDLWCDGLDWDHSETDLLGDPVTTPDVF